MLTSGITSHWPWHTLSSWHIPFVWIPLGTGSPPPTIVAHPPFMHSCGHRSALPSAAYSLLCYHLHTLVLVLCNGHSHFIHSTNILGVFPSCRALRSVLEIWSSPGGDEIDKRQFISIKITTVHLVSQARTRMSSLIPLLPNPTYPIYMWVLLAQLPNYFWYLSSYFQLHSISKDAACRLCMHVILYMWVSVECIPVRGIARSHSLSTCHFDRFYQVALEKLNQFTLPAMMHAWTCSPQPHTNSALIICYLPIW